jgi:hypothetical protein
MAGPFFSLRKNYTFVVFKILFRSDIITSSSVPAMIRTRDTPQIVEKNTGSPLKLSRPLRRTDNVDAERIHAGSNRRDSARPFY